MRRRLLYEEQVRGLQALNEHALLFVLESTSEQRVLQEAASSSSRKIYEVVAPVGRSLSLDAMAQAREIAQARRPDARPAARARPGPASAMHELNDHCLRDIGIWRERSAGPRRYDPDAPAPTWVTRSNIWPASTSKIRDRKAKSTEK